MRSCVVYLLLLLLLAANGYAIWQVHCLRAEIDELHHWMESPRSPEPELLASTAQAALTAIRDGHLREARQKLERLEEQVTTRSQLAAKRKAELRTQIIRARQELAGKSAEAAARIERVVRELSHTPPEKTAGE